MPGVWLSICPLRSICNIIPTLRIFTFKTFQILDLNVNKHPIYTRHGGWGEKQKLDPHRAAQGKLVLSREMSQLWEILSNTYLATKLQGASTLSVCVLLQALLLNTEIEGWCFRRCSEQLCVHSKWHSWKIDPRWVCGHQEFCCVYWGCRVTGVYYRPNLINRVDKSWKVFSYIAGFVVVLCLCACVWQGFTVLPKLVTNSLWNSGGINVATPWLLLPVGI